MAESPPPLDPASDALFLDFDGTLVELAEAPDAILVPADLRPLLARVAERLGGRLALISGRSLEDLQRHLGAAGLVMSGSHGVELALSGAPPIPVEAPEGLAEARDALRAFAAGRSGLLLEEKPAGIALHYRQAPEREAECRDYCAWLAEASGMALAEGKMVVELRPRGVDKGAALRRLMAEPPYAGARPCFVGDDFTDEDGFRAARALGGSGVLVGPPRPTAARWRLGGVAEVLAWLESTARG
ncbi:MAG TPA: trehalose-phosphatase [Allosphingosinicella sp.]|nr:trehalose-phosphatase [Allosphingosinicella sp.]